MNNMNFSEKLAQAIKLNGITQSDLSAKTGISPSSISDWLNGKYVPKQDKIYILATALNVKPSYLLGYDDREPAQQKDFNDLYNFINSTPQDIQEDIYAFGRAANEMTDEEREEMMNFLKRMYKEHF